MNTSDKSDRELLELAAKAAGAEYEWDEDHIELITPISGGSGYFNPLGDDGDAFRLAVTLKIDLRFPTDNDMYVDAGNCDGYTVYLIDTQQDRAAATRRAIVRAAAAIGDAA